MKVKYINEDRVMLSFKASIDYEVHLKIMDIYQALKDYEGIVEINCGYHDILIQYQADVLNIEALIKDLKIFKHEKKHKVIKIPVCYEKPYGIDLDEVCSKLNMNKSTLIEKHTSRKYPVYMMGFLPGFPYLGNLDPSLEIPRRENPRVKIPKGAVGIGGKQTGIYPSDSPGGWQIIGQTPVALLDQVRNDTLIHMGDWVEFYSIDEETYLSMAKGKNYED